MADPLDTPLMWVPKEMVACLHTPGVPSAGCAKRHCTTHTSDWRAAPGSPENLHRVRAEKLTTIRALAARHFTTAALVSGYVITRDEVPMPTAPRVTKESVPWVRSQGLRVTQTCFIADVDTMPHVPWTPEAMSDFEATWATAPSLRTCGLYLSQRGYRLLQPLATWLDVEDAEPRYHAWLHQLVAEGVWASALECKDFGHLMRVPHFRDADGLQVISPRVDFTRLAFVEAPEGVVSPRRATRRNARPASPDSVGVLPRFEDVVPLGWEPVADAVGGAIRDHVRAKWRDCYMALSGALCARGCPVEGVPAVIARAHAVDQSYPEWQNLLADRVELARSTVVRWANGLDLLGYGALCERYPEVAEALDTTTTAGIEAEVLEQLRRPAPVRITAAEATCIIARAVDEAYGVVCVAAPPGTGKTRSVIERARRLPVIQGRAAPGNRIALSVPRHELALQVVSALPENARRLFSPVSHLAPDGSFTCLYHDAAEALAGGGQSVTVEFCEGRGRSPCEMRDVCPAFPGSEGPEGGALVVGVHGLVRQLRGAAGKAGVLVIDEPGEVTFTEVVTRAQFAGAIEHLGGFVPRYAAAIAPALTALAAWTGELGPVGAALVSLEQAVHEGCPAIPAEQLVEAGIDPDEVDLGTAVMVAAAGAILGSVRSKSPPLQWGSVSQARANAGRARQLGEASRVLNLLWRGVTCPVAWALRIDDRGGDRTLTITGPNDETILALTHEGPVVVLDANAALHIEAYEKVLGYRPKFIQVDVADGAPVARTILATRATAAKWFPRGVPEWDSILPSVRAMVAWVREDAATRRVGLMAPMVLEAAIAHAIDPADPLPRKVWQEKNLSLAALARARDLLAPLLAVPGVTWVLGHFNNLRGMDHMADCDATMTLSDPRPNLGQERDKAEYLSRDLRDRLRDLAAAELGQAHGRLRTIHRTRPGRQFHAGGVVPDGWGGYPVEVRRLPVGRPRTVTTMTAEEFRAHRAAMGMSQSALAKVLRCGVGSVKHYEAGRAPVPEDVARAVRTLSPVGSETPTRELLLVGVSDPFPRSGGF